MHKEIFKSLGARELNSDSTEAYDLADVQSILGINFPDEYISLLKEYNNSIVFDNGAIFMPKKESPVDSSSGYQSLEMLYGLKGDSNLVKRNQMYKDQIPSEFVTIGESVGGNQICLSSTDGGIYFWFHEAETEDETFYEIADNITDFFKSLSSDDDQVQVKREIDESESFLDF